MLSLAKCVIQHRLEYPLPSYNTIWQNLYPFPYTPSALYNNVNGHQAANKRDHLSFNFRTHCILQLLKLTMPNLVLKFTAENDSNKLLQHW